MPGVRRTLVVVRAMKTANLGLPLFGDTRNAVAQYPCSLKPGSVRLQGPSNGRS